jgi:predicted porin
MNKNIKLAVAGAVIAMSATAANAGIIIPAGEWTLDIGGNVNTYATWTRNTGTATTGYATLWAGSGQGDALSGLSGDNRTQSNITTGLLPNYLSVTGTTRQNDLDVSFTISVNPGTSTTQSGKQSSHQENRQAFMTFGDKSWGSVKLGKDLGIFASDAILNDMTLLGVGSGAGGLAGNTTTTGRIGTGFMYADWKGQIAYTTPNFNGFQATVGITQPFNVWSNIAPGTARVVTVVGDGGVSNALTGTVTAAVAGDAFSSGRGGANMAYEGKASYSWSGDFAGKIWVSGIAQKVNSLKASGTETGVGGSDTFVKAGDIGANVNVAGFGLTGYYYRGEGIGQTVQLNGGFDKTGARRDSEGGYVQATYVLPTKTKLGLSWGESKLESNGTNDGMTGDLTDEMWAVGAYHPLTKHLNLVAEYTSVESEYKGTGTARGRTGSLGAILFF